MSAPLLQEIRDRFDNFGPTIDGLSGTNSIKIEPASEGYSVTTYPLGTNGFDGFTSSITVPNGIFGQEGPSRVEVSRETRGIVNMSVDVIATDEEGFSITRITEETVPAREGLLKPGDPEFELYYQLHAELRARKTAIAKALGKLGVEVEPTSFTYHSQIRTAGRFDYVHRTSIPGLYTHIDVVGKDRTNKDNVDGHIELDGSPVSHAQPRWPMVYRSGTARFDWQRTSRATDPVVGDEALRAFADLYADFATLYTNDH